MSVGSLPRNLLPSINLSCSGCNIVIFRYVSRDGRFQSGLNHVDIKRWASEQQAVRRGAQRNAEQNAGHGEAEQARKTAGEAEENADAGQVEGLNQQAR